MTDEGTMDTDLYRFFDGDGVLLYVGISLSAAHRASQHRASQSWWRQVSTMTVEHFNRREDAARFEVLAIARERPVHNLASRPKNPLRWREIRRQYGTVVIVDGHVLPDRSLVVPLCPGCGKRHTHGASELDQRRGFTHRFPHCRDGFWCRPGEKEPWQVIRVRRPFALERPRPFSDGVVSVRRDRDHAQFSIWAGK